ncbi:hypothetical protein Cantr_10602 [Candida viswanathii]|uniref:SH3 domain-containing protein n=1 Tax=Candida viswanathii TaxID=5486 RepID=A0A367YE82_9ASCO|nr:hypothetical protein Cantr_10602 [Candida viswanathii]
MAILRKRDDDGDSTIYLTLTSTSTMSSRTTQPTTTGDSVVEYVTWVPQTTLQTYVTSALVTSLSSNAQAQPTTITTIRSTSSSPGATTVYVSPSSSTSSSETTSPTTTTQDITQSSSTSTTTSSARRISSTSDVPTLSTLNDIPATSSTNRSTEIGLAIGIPIAIFSIFFIVLGIWYFIRSRKNKKNKTKQLSFNDSYYKSRSSDETITPDKPYPVVFSPGAYLKQEQEGRSMKGYEVEQGKESGIAKRFSRMFPVRNKDLEGGGGGVEGVSEGPQSNFMKRMSVMTPIFLKKFNLGKVDEVDELPVKVDKDTIKPQVLTIDDEGRKVPKVKNKLNLPPTITIGESGLDPVRGGVSPEQSLYTVIRSYSKNLGDELDIEVGDKVVILEKHSDGWCKVRKIRMGKEYYVHQSSPDTGLVPRMCLQKI